MSPLPSHSSSEQLSDLSCDVDELLREAKAISLIAPAPQLSVRMRNERNRSTVHIDAGETASSEVEGVEEEELTPTQSSLRWRKWREELVESTWASVVGSNVDQGELHTVMLRQTLPPPLPSSPPPPLPVHPGTVDNGKALICAKSRREQPSSPIRSRFSRQERGEFLRASRYGSNSVSSTTPLLSPRADSGLVGYSDPSIQPGLGLSEDHALTTDTPGVERSSQRRPRPEAWDLTSSVIDHNEELHKELNDTKTQGTPVAEARAYLANFYAQEIRNSIRHHEIHEPAPCLRHISIVGEEQLQYPASFFCVADTTPERQVHFERAYGRLMGDIPDTPWNIPRFREFYVEHMRLREIRANEIEPVMEMREELWVAEPELEEDERKGLRLSVRSNTTFGGSFVKRFGSIRSTRSSDGRKRV